MMNAAIVGMGWWGRTLVEAVADSEQIRVVAGATRTVSPEVKTFSETHKLTLVVKSAGSGRVEKVA
jgi:predicted dinucleotide-binding enzyme